MACRRWAVAIRPTHPCADPAVGRPPTRAPPLARHAQPEEEDTVLVKKYPSAFFGTELASMLTARGVDTIILVGCSTSGCIRATALDAMQHGFRCVVPRECVGDRTAAVHESNLFDINSKNGDVLPKRTVMDFLSRL